MSLPSLLDQRGRGVRRSKLVGTYAGRPRLFDAGQGKNRAQQRHVLTEMNHFVLPGLRVILIPEIVYQWGDCSEKAEETCGAKLRLDSEDEADAAQGEGNSGSDDRGVRRGNSFCSRVLSERAPFLKVINSVVKEKTAEDDVAE